MSTWTAIAVNKNQASRPNAKKSGEQRRHDPDAAVPGHPNRCRWRIGDGLDLLGRQVRGAAGLRRVLLLRGRSMDAEVEPLRGELAVDANRSHLDRVAVAQPARGLQQVSVAGDGDTAGSGLHEHLIVREADQSQRPARLGAGDRDRRVGAAAHREGKIVTAVDALLLRVSNDDRGAQIRSSQRTTTGAGCSPGRTVKRLRTSRYPSRVPTTV